MASELPNVTPELKRKVTAGVLEEASAGGVSAPVVQRNADIDGLRVAFSFDPKGAATSELRLVLQNNDKVLSDTWLYRWTKD